MTRSGIALGCLLWLIVMSLPMLALFLYANNEIAWRRGPQGLEVDKLFLINEPAYAGLGFETARVQGGDGSSLCVATSVTYVFWRNDSGLDQNTAFCQCYDAQGAPIGVCP